MSAASIEELIIERVQCYPYLYKKNNKDYVNTLKDDIAWFEIAEYVADKKKKCPVSQVYITM